MEGGPLAPVLVVSFGRHSKSFHIASIPPTTSTSLLEFVPTHALIFMVLCPRVTSSTIWMTVITHGFLLANVAGHNG